MGTTRLVLNWVIAFKSSTCFGKFFEIRRNMAFHIAYQKSFSEIFEAFASSFQRRRVNYSKNPKN